MLSSTMTIAMAQASPLATAVIASNSGALAAVTTLTLGRVAASGSLSRVSRPNTLDQRRNFFEVVQHGEEAYRLFFGQNPKKLGPGLRLNLPLLHDFRRVDLREGTISVSSLDAFTKDNVPVTLSGSLFYKVNNAYAACFNVQDYKGAVRHLGTSVARSVIGNFDYEEINSDRNRINELLRKMIDSQIDNWGILCTRFEIQEFAPQNENVKRLLELQMEAERKRRENDLNTAASIRTAEGSKASEILKSEGLLAAARNAAEASFTERVRQADAIKYSIEAEATAKALEIETIAKVMGGDVSAATKFLLEAKRIEQLKAIAEGHNNSSYFYPNSNSESTSSIVPMLALDTFSQASKVKSANPTTDA